MWFERYTEERLLQRTNAIFNGALQIYNRIVERWLPAFNKRNQMRYMLPFRMGGELRLLEASKPNDRKEAVLIHWDEWVDDIRRLRSIHRNGTKGEDHRQRCSDENSGSP